LPIGVVTESEHAESEEISLLLSLVRIGKLVLQKTWSAPMGYIVKHSYADELSSKELSETLQAWGYPNL
jgi:hypothetical protein